MFEIYPNSSNSLLVVEDMKTGAIVPLKDMAFGWILKVDNAIKETYPETYDQLVDLEGGKKNNALMRVKQFLSCNFSFKDGLPDIDEHFNFKLEKVFCPARNTGICKLGICSPKITHKFSRCEKMVLNLFYVGMSEEEIGEKLFISRCTVHNHINNMYAKAGVKGQSNPDRRLIAYAVKNRLV